MPNNRGLLISLTNKTSGGWRFQMWLIQKLNDIRAAVTHIFILCFPPNSIFFVVVVLLVLHRGLSKVTLVPSTKYCQKGREKICPRIPQNTSLLVPLARIGSHDINAEEAGKVSLCLVSWKTGSAGNQKVTRNWQEKAANCDAPFLLSHVEAFFFGYADIWKSQNPTATQRQSQANNLRWCSGSGPDTAPPNDVIF